MKTLKFIALLAVFSLISTNTWARFVTVCPLDGRPCQTVIVWD